MLLKKTILIRPASQAQGSYNECAVTVAYTYTNEI